MSLTVDSSPTESFHGTSSSGSDQHHSLHHLASERAVPLPIRSRPAGSQGVLVDDIPGGGSNGSFHTRQLHRDSFHERRDHRSYSTEWISSPLLEGFASFHHALNTVQEVTSNLGTPASGQGDMSCALPYLGTCWSHDHSGESSVGSSRSTQCSSTPGPLGSTSLAVDDWDILKSQSLSSDMSSPVPMESFMPFLFPMDPDVGNQQQPHSSALLQSPVFAPSDHYHHLNSDGIYALDTSAHASQHPPSPPPYSNPPGSNNQSSHNQWQFELKQSPTAVSGQPRPPTVSTTGLGLVGGYAPGYSAIMTTSARTPPHQPEYPQQRITPKIRNSSTASFSSTTSLGMTTSTAAPTAASMISKSAPVANPSLPMADIQLLTKLNQCYWKNGRKNLQCFPICPEHNDFYSMKMSNRKHTSVGVCRGPVYTHVFLPAVGPRAKPSRTTGQHMKYEFGVGASGSGGSAFEIFVLGKFERVPQRNEDDELFDLLPPPDHFRRSSEFEAFRYSCFQAVEMEERRVTTRTAGNAAGQLPEEIVRSTWFFLPDVWKVQPMLKKKRKATRSAPAQAFPFCFRVFVYVREPDSSSSSSSDTHSSNNQAPSDARYSCIATVASSFFELYSTRTVDRVKRKYWSRDDGEDEAGESASSCGADTMAASMASTPSSTHVAKRPSRA